MERVIGQAEFGRLKSYPVKSITRRNVRIKRIAIRAEEKKLRQRRIDAVLGKFCESIGLERSSLTCVNGVKAVIGMLSAWLMLCLMM